MDSSIGVFLLGCRLFWGENHEMITLFQYIIVLCIYINNVIIPDHIRNLLDLTNTYRIVLYCTVHIIVHLDCSRASVLIPYHAVCKLKLGFATEKYSQTNLESISVVPLSLFSRLHLTALLSPRYTRICFIYLSGLFFDSSVSQSWIESLLDEKKKDWMRKSFSVKPQTGLLIHNSGDAGPTARPIALVHAAIEMPVDMVESSSSKMQIPRSNCSPCHYVPHEETNLRTVDCGLYT